MRARLNKFTVAGLGVLLLFGITTAYAATSVISGVGTIANHAPFGGPATMTARSLFIGANEVLPWHQHPGIGAYTIVRHADRGRWLRRRDRLPTGFGVHRARGSRPPGYRR